MSSVSAEFTRTMAVGSTNPAKVEAVRRAVNAIWPDMRIAPYAVSSGVGEMPMSDIEGRRGAVQRARAALEQMGADYGVGLEGGVHDADGEMFLTNWVAIVSRDGKVGLACGGRFPLPKIIAQEIRQGAELGPIIDRYTGKHHTKQGEGAAGFFTCGLVPRTLVFQVGVGLALAPFLRPALYHTEDEPC